MDATSMLQQLAEGTTNAEQLVSNSIAQIKAAHSKLNAATEILETQAQQQLRDLPGGPLKGLPISIKECYAIAGRTITSGSLRMKPLACSEDASVVKKLKAAGAIVVARGNTSEFLLGRETDNLVCGPTNNVIDPANTAGGSSGGDAALTATEAVAFGIGTDIGGSCRYPALFNGIVGFKPASGQIDKTGVFPSAAHPFVESMNSPGILCRSVRDVRLVYNVIGNKQLAQNNSLAGLQLYTASTFKVRITEQCISDALTASTEFFRTNGVAVKDVVIPDSASHYNDFGALMGAGFTDKIYEWSRTANGKKLSFIGELFRRMLGKPTISNELFAMLLPFNIIKPSARKLEKVIAKVTAAREKYAQLLGSDGILILPTTGILAPRHGKFYPMYTKPTVPEIITPVSFCNIYNLSCITLPAWKYQKDRTKTPPGIMLIAADGNEELLLTASEQLEKHISNI